ncbi:MAG: DUF6798 domain-containing protein [Terracidiphilus sp.]
MKRNRLFRVVIPILLFSVLGFLVMGYHPGAEDDGIYLSAIKADLNPSLYPFNAGFFTLQMKASVFPNCMAEFIRASHIPIAWSELLWQWISIVLILWGCWSIVSQLFEETAARWAGLATVAAMFTLPVAGTALFIVDQYLHPRALATAMILFAASRILADKSWQALPFGFLAMVAHPLMGILGVSFCCVLGMTRSVSVRDCQESFSSPRGAEREAAPVLAMIPFGWIFDPPSPTWLEALRSRHWFRLYQWEWYEWLGAIAPLAIFWLVARMAKKCGETKLARLATAIWIYGVFQMAVAMVILGPQRLIGLSTLEPMRFLHLIYVFMALIGGAYLGKYLLKARAWRWALFLLLANGGMLLAQRQLFPASDHLELPGMNSANPWLQAFDWIRNNTPKDAYFAVDPKYMAAPGEDYHSFRALAERSQLADAIKDTSVVTKVPELGPDWKLQLEAEDGWANFKLADFERLKMQFGVSWVLVAYPPPDGLDCRWHNDALSVCQVP